jgi:hypothetical protein
MEPAHPARVVATRLLFAALIAASILFASRRAAAQIVEWRIEDGGNGHAYTLLSHHDPNLPLTWWDARAMAESARGHLATLSTRAEAEWVFAHVVAAGWAWPTAAGPWIGALRTTIVDQRGRTAEGWRWIDGSAWEWSPWSDALCAVPSSDCDKGP